MKNRGAVLFGEHQKAVKEKGARKRYVYRLKESK